MTPRALFHPARLARKPVLSTQSDERLVDLVRAGSDPAFEAIVERYRKPLGFLQINGHSQRVDNRGLVDTLLAAVDARR